MPAPKLKLYQLPPGFTEENDSDIQHKLGDELLPVEKRSELLSEAVLLTGVYLPAAAGDNCQPDNSGAVAPTPEALGPDAAAIQISTNMATFIWAVGARGPVVKDSLDTVIPREPYPGAVPPAGTFYWRKVPTGIEFVRDDTTAYPSGATVEPYREAAAGTEWALPYETPYAGGNLSFALLISVDSGAWRRLTVAESVSGGILTIASTAAAVKVRGAFVCRYAQHFIGEHPNWVLGHMDQWPDVFVGEEDYPGDTHTIENPGGGTTIVDPGPQPSWRDPGTYSLYARDGRVTFNEFIDSQTSAVKALYAYLKGIANVTGQQLTVVAGSGGTRFKADTEAAFPQSHGKKWLSRNTAYTPITVYVDGDVTPTVQHQSGPYETLTVKTS